MTRPTIRLARHCATLSLLALFGAAAGNADWLVMTDGSRIETDGPWTARGNLLVFTDTTGTLVSVRAAEVDLAASERLTREMSEPPAPPPPPAPPRPSVFRLTDEDVGHVDDEEFAAETGDEGAAEGEEPPPLIAVTAWERDDTPAGDGLEVRATLENQGNEVAVNLAVNVTVYDDTGAVLATSQGALAASGLVPGQTTEMVASFPGIFDFTAVDFDVQHRAIATRAVEAAPDLGEDFGDG